jgi:hypothetical protein
MMHVETLANAGKRFDGRRCASMGTDCQRGGIMGWWPFNTLTSGSPRRRRRTALAVIETSFIPLCAYVRRTAPRRWEGRDLPDNIGRVDNIHDIREDLEREVFSRAGGGSYRCRMFVMTDKRRYLGTVNLVLVGEPLVDGEPVE